MNKPIQFSIIIPAYNAGATLEMALESVIAQDSDCEWEAVVVNDGSADNTYDVCQAYAARDDRIKIFTQANRGTGAALNEAAHHATGEFLVQLGADDLLDSAYMRKTNALIKTHPTYDVYASNALRLYESGETSPCLKGGFFKKKREITFEDLIWSNKIYGTAAIRRTLFWRVGGFQAGFYNEDYDLWLRLLIEGAQACFQPEYLAFYRVTQGQKTENTIKVRRGDIAILKSLRSEYSFGITDRICIDFEIKLLQLKIVIKKLLGMH